MSLIIGCRQADILPPMPVVQVTPVVQGQVSAESLQPTPTLLAPIQVDRSAQPPATQSARLASPLVITDEVPQAVIDLLVAEGIDTEGVVLRMFQGRPIGQWVYAAVLPFYSLTEAVPLAQLQSRWRGEDMGGLIVSAETAAVFSHVWGDAAETVEIMPPAELTSRLWQSDGAIGIVPFEQLTPDLRVLAVDGFSPLDADVAAPVYGLTVPIAVNGDITAVAEFARHFEHPLTNRELDQMTTVAMTGVTALVRATAYAMEQHGVLWPGEEVRAVLNSADIAHVSNEIAFVPDCPYPDPVGGTRFCSDVRYFELLQDLGIDVVELTGNHVNDYGAQFLASSIDLYEAAGMRYFGGGRDVADAQSPAIFEHNGNQIVFLGCNIFGPPLAWAGQSVAGSRACDAELEAQISQFSQAGAVVITTLQYTEFYEYAATYQQQRDFRRYVDAGASIVSGSQGHHLQAFDLYHTGFIHYGVGNLFFDQMFSDGTRQSFIDEYVIYKGQLIGVNLHTYLIEAFARPRLMNAAERRQVLEILYRTSLYAP